MSIRATRIPRHLGNGYGPNPPTIRDAWIRQGQGTRNGSAGVRCERLCFEVSGLKYLTYLKIQGQQAWDSTCSIRR